MQTIKKLWARFVQSCFEARERRLARRNELTPDEIIARLRKCQQIMNDAAAKAGVL